MPDFSSLLANIKQDRSINALVIVASQIVMTALADPNTQKPVIRWIAKYAKNEGEIQEACKTYALFIASDSSMLVLDGDFSLAGSAGMPTLAQVGQVMAAKLTAWAVATADA